MVLWKITTIFQVLIYQKNVQKTFKNMQKRAFQIFLDPIQKRASSRSVQLEAVYLEALLYCLVILLNKKPQFRGCVQALQRKGPRFKSGLSHQLLLKIEIVVSLQPVVYIFSIQF